jgi:hypothetical protein
VRDVTPHASLILCCYLYQDRDKDPMSQALWAQVLERGGEGMIPWMIFKEMVRIIRTAYGQKRQAR